MFADLNCLIMFRYINNFCNTVIYKLGFMLVIITLQIKLLISVNNRWFKIIVNVQLTFSLLIIT